MSRCCPSNPHGFSRQYVVLKHYGKSPYSLIGYLKSERKTASFLSWQFLVRPRELEPPPTCMD